MKKKLLEKKNEGVEFTNWSKSTKDNIVLELLTPKVYDAIESSMIYTDTIYDTTVVYFCYLPLDWGEYCGMYRILKREYIDDEGNDDSHNRPDELIKIEKLDINSVYRQLEVWDSDMFFEVREYFAEHPEEFNEDVKNFLQLYNSN